MLWFDENSISSIYILYMVSIDDNKSSCMLWQYSIQCPGSCFACVTYYSQVSIINPPKTKYQYREQIYTMLSNTDINIISVLTYLGIYAFAVS